MKKISMFIILLISSFVFSNSIMAEEISVVGTGSGMNLLKAVAEEFNKNNPEIKIIVPKSIGSGGGIKSVGADKFLIGRVGREIKEKEKYLNLSYQPFAKLPIVFFMHRGSGVKDLSAQQICDIFSGKIKTWQEVGGNKQRIRIIRREEGDSSLSVLKKSFPGFKDITITSKSKTTFSDHETLEAAEQKAGVITFGTLSNAMKHDVDILNINGKMPTDVSYPYHGTLALIYKEKNNIGNIRKFTEFVKSDQAKEVIKKTGAQPF